MYEIVLNPYEIGTALFIGLFGCIYINILTDEGMIFEKYYEFLMKYEKRKWLVNPLGYCEYCLVGQISFWLYLIYYLNEYNIIHGISHVFFVITTIFFTQIFNSIFIWLKNLNS